MKKNLLILMLPLLIGCNHRSRLFGGDDTSIKNYVITNDPKIANTGIGYDSDRNQLLNGIWDTNANRTYLLVNDMNMNKIGEVPLPADMVIVEGVSYDSDRHQILVWGDTELDPDGVPIDTKVYALDHEGRILRGWNAPFPNKEPGQIMYAGHQQLWIKGNGDRVAHLYDMGLTLSLVRDVNTGFGGEGIADDLHGNIYLHDHCKIRKYNLLTNHTEDFDSPSYTCGAEGLTFDGIGNLWVSSDDAFHGGGPDQVWRMSL